MRGQWQPLVLADGAVTVGWVAGADPQACGRGSNSDRIRSTTTAALRTKLVELMNDFQALNTRLKNEYRHAPPMNYQWLPSPPCALPLVQSCCRCVKCAVQEIAV